MVSSSTCDIVQNVSRTNGQMSNVTLQHSRPGVRDILIERADNHPFHTFSDYYSQSVTVNWKYDVLDAVADHGGDTVIHSIFEKHICNLANWTVTKEFLVRFPHMSSNISTSVSKDSAP